MEIRLNSRLFPVLVPSSVLEILWLFPQLTWKLVKNAEPGTQLRSESESASSPEP